MHVETRLLAYLALLLFPLRALAQVPDPDVLKGKGITGEVYSYKRFPSGHVLDRNVEVWLPPSYSKDRKKRYPVIYIQDGQNAFNPRTSYGGNEWGIDETMTRLIVARKAPEVILVAIWNTGALRGAEYMPQLPYEEADSADKADAIDFIKNTPISDRYLLFLVEELKPFIDGRYRTLKDRRNTSILGSSMGGLISLYALCQYPQVFGGAACISTHWPVGNGLVIPYISDNLPDPHTHRLYFDHGTLSLDSAYAPYQTEVDSILEKDGYKRGQNLSSRTFRGDTHSEISWSKRVELPLRFLLLPGQKRSPGKAAFAKKQPGQGSK